MITVRELREALQDLPDDMPVWLQSDAEGNGYERLRCVDPDGIANPHERGPSFPPSGRPVRRVSMRRSGIS